MGSRTVSKHPPIHHYLRTQVQRRTKGLLSYKHFLVSNIFEVLEPKAPYYEKHKNYEIFMFLSLPVNLVKF